ncbi:2-oxoacid:acceptor oxidoreductase family protein, partial [Candidatus Aerophobetes bacterium]|nr:2-oxoacid:acceptor oxidoreductase family protein [Candidatus Aerophobetes bacterium]
MGKLFEVRWHGRAGQGAKTAALLLAEAALSEGKYIQGFPEYGPEREGAPIRAYTRISDSPIYIHSGVANPDAVVVLDSTLIGVVDITEGLGKDGVILINTEENPGKIRERLNFPDGKLYTVDATGISLEILGRNLPNMPMVGALIRVLPVLKLDVL